MKNNFFFTVFAAVAAVVSCQRQNEQTLSLDCDLISFPPAGGTIDVELTSGGAWTAESHSKWVTVYPVSGNGNGTVTVAAGEWINDDSDEGRMTVITFTDESGREKDIFINQINDENKLVGPSSEVIVRDFNPGSYGIVSVGEDSLHFPVQGGEFRAWVFHKGNLPFDVSCDSSWVKANPASGVGGSDGGEFVTFTVDEWSNEGNEESRAAKVRLASDGTYDYLVIRQFSSPDIEISPR